MIFIGIDPGANGAATIMQNDGSIFDVIEFKKNTELDVVNILREHASFFKDDGVKALIENVHAMPKQGVSSTFKFGCGYGFLLGVLTALKIPYEKVTPQKWQGFLGCRSKGDKNVTKSKAQQLFPNETITHAKADSMLIAEYARRTHI